MKVLKWLDRYFEIIYLVLALAAIVVIMTTQIICRKFFDVSLAWTEECCRHLFIGMGIWGIALTIRENSAIKFDLIVDFLPSKGKAIFGLVANLIMLSFFSCLLVPSYNVYLSMKATSATVMPYNMDLVYGFLALGFFMVIVRSCQMCVINLKKILSKRNGEQEVEKQ
jgi:TRAP-type C4-dicarboxylate transport system permease small subunit